MLPFFDCRHDARGVIAVGQMATGVFAFGQMATGVIAVGQLARGVVAVGQLAMGLVTVGQLSVGLVRGWGMLTASAQARGLLALSVIPRPTVETETRTVPVAVVAGGEVSEGWVRLVAHPGPHGGLTWTEDGQAVAAEVHLPHPNPLLRGLRRPREVLLRVTPVDVFDEKSLGGLRSAAPFHRRLVIAEVKAVARQGGPSIVGWIARGVLGIALTVGVAQYALRPVIEVFLK